MSRSKFNKVMILLIIITLVIPLFSIQSQTINESDNDPVYSNYNYLDNYNLTPHIEVDAEVFPNAIYKLDDPTMPRTASVRLNVYGKGDIIPESGKQKPADIVFVVDTTGSMDNDLAEVQDSIEEIVIAVEENITDVQFGLASYRDHYGYYSGCGWSSAYGMSYDYVFNVDQKLTKDTGSFKNAVNSLISGGGSDGKTSVVDAIYYTTHNFNWRGGKVMKIAILMGDGVGHDCNNTYDHWGDYASTGYCPNNFTFTGVVEDTVKNDVVWMSIGIDDTEYNDTVGWAQWNYLIEKSGGIYRAKGYDDLADIIIELLGKIIPEVNIAGKDVVVKMTLEPDFQIVDDLIIPSADVFEPPRTFIWKLGTIKINQTVVIKFDIKSSVVGQEKEVLEYPETILKYKAWNGSAFVNTNILSFNKLVIDVLESSASNIKPPVSNVIYPINNRYYYHLAEISGTAFDNTYNAESGIKKVEINIERLGDNYYWNGTVWVKDKTWLTTTGDILWEFNSTNVHWSSGQRYAVLSQATNLANIFELPEGRVIFGIDKENPRSKIDFPYNNSFLNSVKSISGTTMDYGGAGLDYVEICIIRDLDNYYWDEYEWTKNETWLKVSETEEWTFDSTDVKWTTDLYYKIKCRGIDNIGNLETPNSFVYFMYDDKPPVTKILINNGSKFTNEPKISLSLEYSDTGSGASIMRVSADAASWTPWEEIDNNRAFELTGDDGEKIVYFSVMDRAGNIAEPVNDKIILDTTPPVELSIIINDDKIYTNDSIVTLELNAKDLLSGLNSMSFYYTDMWTIWEPFNTSITLTLPTGDGEKLVNFKVSDNAGNIAEPVFDSIILDTTPPHSLKIIINDNSFETNSTTLVLTLTAIDDLSGVDQMSLSSDGITWKSWEDYSETRIYDLGTGNENSNDKNNDTGINTIYFKVRDKVNNIADPVSTSIRVVPDEKPDVVDRKPVDEEAVEDIDLIVIIIIVIIVVSIIVLYSLMKTRKPKKKNDISTDKK